MQIKNISFKPELKLVGLLDLPFPNSQICFSEPELQLAIVKILLNSTNIKMYKKYAILIDIPEK